MRGRHRRARRGSGCSGSHGPRACTRLPRYAGARHTAPSTAGDLLFHIRARRLDLCFELAQRLTERLRGAGRVVDEVHGFRSFDERDLLGFVDGTENPDGGEARDAVLIGDEDPAFAGGSYVIVQKYLHDLSAWDALAVAEQERIIGRTKLSDLEFPDELKATNSHVALNTIVDDDGNERQIMRFNMPFGRVGVGEFGTYFIGYAHSPDVIERMLSNMFIGKPRGQLRPHPRLLHGRHREPVLRAQHRLSRRPAGARRGAGSRRRRPSLGPGLRLQGDDGPGCARGPGPCRGP